MLSSRSPSATVCSTSVTPVVEGMNRLRTKRISRGNPSLSVRVIVATSRFAYRLVGSNMGFSPVVVVALTRDRVCAVDRCHKLLRHLMSHEKRAAHTQEPEVLV